ncbi:TPA: hypothetical protein ACH3X3_006042 [Trebouxia sp. C0006]
MGRDRHDSVGSTTTLLKSAIILDAPMTLLWAWQQLPIWLAASSSKHLHDINIHYLGAQKELDQWPVFLELLHLMPCTSLHISFISPDVPSNLDGKRKIFTKQQGSNELTDAAQTACISSDCETVVASDAAMMNSSCCLSHGEQKQFSSKLCSPRDGSNGMHSVVWSAETQRSAANDAAQMAQPASPADTISQTLQLSFYTGCYHDVAGDIQQEFRRPDLVFGANAGLAAYPSWVPTLQLLSHRSAPASIFTDFCEEAAFQGMRVMQAVAQGPMQWMPVAVNPFRKPLSCQGRDNNLPSYSNAFIFGMAPVADEHE